MINLTKETVLDLCELADLVETRGDGTAHLGIELSGTLARVVQRWSNRNIRRDEVQLRRDLRRYEKLEKQGDPFAIRLMAGRRAIRARERQAGKPLTLDQRAAILREVDAKYDSREISGSHVPCPAA